MLSFVVIMAPWTWPIRRPHMHLERGPPHQHVMDKLNWPTMARRVADISMTPTGPPVLVGFKTFKRMDMRLVGNCPSRQPHVFSAGPQWPPSRPIVARRKFLMWRLYDKRWCKGHLRLQAAEYLVGAACLMRCFVLKAKRTDRDGSRVPHDPWQVVELRLGSAV